MMAPPNGYMYLLRGQGASYYPSVIIRAIILLRLRNIIINQSGTRPALSWIFYFFSILFNLTHLFKPLQTLGFPQNTSKRRINRNSNNKNNLAALQSSGDPSIISQFLWDIVWPSMPPRSRPPTEIERRIFKLKRDINTTAIAHLDRAVDRMAVAFAPGIRFANLDFNGPAFTTQSHSRPGGDIMHYHANSDIQAMSDPIPIPAVHQHPENRHTYRHFAGIPDNRTDINYLTSMYSIRTEIEPYPPSTGRGLETISARNLVVGERSFGSCLVLKTILSPKHLDATHVLVEDEGGKWELLHIFNFHYTNHTDDRVGQGQLLLIKEPYYYRGYGGMPAIRVDHPSDITYIMYDHPLVPDKWKRKDAHGLDAEPKILKMDGEVRMRWKKYHQAIDCLSLAYKIHERNQQETQKNFSRPSSIGIHLTAKFEVLKLRVGCYHHLKMWEKSLCDAETIMSVSFNEKAAWYRANALFNLGSYDEAKQFILRIMGGSRYKFKECSRLHSRVRNFQNNNMGQYNMTQILERGKEGHHEVSAGNFISGVRIRRSLTISGYGLFAQRDFKAGDLIMAVKALSTVYGAENVGLHVKSRHDEFIKTKYGQKMVAETISRIYAEPKNVGAVMQKLDRENFEVTFFRRDGELLVNGFWVDEVVEKYSMQHSIYNKRIPDLDGILDPEIFLDGVRSRRTYTPSSSVSFSARNASNVSINGYSEGGGVPHEPGMADQISFFAQAAYMNHSCIPNVRISIFSDIMFVYAATNVPKDDELLINYLDDDYSPLNERREALRDHFGFECNCIRCEYESSNFEYLSDRTNIHEAIGELMTGNYTESPEVILEGITQCIKILKDGYQDTLVELPQFDMAWALMAEEYFRRKVEHGSKRTGKTAELRNLKLALLMLRALGAEYEFVEGDVKVLRYGFICKWLVEAWILAAISSARFYGGVFWTLRVVARGVYGILCGETVTFEKLFWGRLEEAEVAELTEEKMLSMSELVEWLKWEGLEKTELAGDTDW